MENLENVIKDFFYEMEFKENKSTNTIISMKNDIKQMVDFFIANNFSLNFENDDINKLDLFINYLKKNFSEKSVSRKISSIKKFISFLSEKKIIKNNISLAIKFSEKKNEEEIFYLDVEYIKRLRTVISKNNFNSLRDLLLMELMYSSGISPKDVLMLSELNFNIKERTLYIFKNNTSQELYFSKNTVTAYENYIKIKEEKFADENKKEILFVNNSNERLSARSLRRIFQKYFERANINKKASLYSFRHSFCIYMLRNNFDKLYLKKLLALKNDDVVRKYEEIK